MGKTVPPIPKGKHAVSAYLVIKNAKEALDFYKKALGAEVTAMMPGPDGSVMHAEFRIGDHEIYCTEENLEWGKKSPATLGGNATSLHLYVDDVDSFVKRAVDAGAEITMPVEDVFWGDRYGQIKDPYGHEWAIATHKKDLTPEEMMKGAQEFFESAAKQ